MKLFLMLLLTFFWTQDALAQKPILPLQYSSQGIPFLAESLRDPTLAKNMVSDDLGYENLTQDLEMYEQDLIGTAGLRRQELLEKLYLGNQNIVYFLEDVAAQRISVMADYKGISKKLTQPERRRINLFFNMLETTAIEQLCASILSSIHKSLYLHESKDSICFILKKVRKHMNAYLKRRVDYLEAIHLVVYKNKGESIRDIQKLIPSLPSITSISARLLLSPSILPA